MRALWLLSLALLLSGCTSGSVSPDQALSDWQDLQAAAGPGGDLLLQSGKTTFNVPDYDMRFVLGTRMEWFEDGWRLRLDVDEARFSGQDRTGDYGDLALTFLCVPGAVAFETEGMAAFGRNDLDGRASHSASCLDADDHGRIAAAFSQLAGNDFPLDGIEALLSLTSVPDVAFTSGSEDGDERTLTFQHSEGGLLVEMTVQVIQDRVRFLSVHAEADGVVADAALEVLYGPRAPSPAL